MNHNLLIFVLHEDPLLARSVLRDAMANECNNKQPTVIAHFKDKLYEIKSLPADFALREHYKEASLTEDLWLLLIQVIREQYHLKTISLCCYANLTRAHLHQVTLETHAVIQALKPKHVILIAVENGHCFKDSELYLAGRPNIIQLILPVSVKMATVVSRNDLVRKIKQAHTQPTPIRSRTSTYNFLYYFSCCCARKKDIVQLDTLDDDERGDDYLDNISFHPDIPASPRKGNNRFYNMASDGRENETISTPRATISFI